MIRAFEAFSGYGSQTLEMKYLGIDFESVGIAEIDKYAIQAHEILHGPVKNYGDVSLLDVEELPDMDLFTYSFPCQDISNAGKQRGLEKGSGTRSSLLWECERIIEGKRPKFLMMENVKNLVGKKNKPHFDEWLQVLTNLGYNNYWKIINGKWCGVPQNRERVFCVSVRKDIDNGLFSFYEDFDNGIRLKDILEPVVDEKYYLSEEKTKGLIETIHFGKNYAQYDLSGKGHKSQDQRAFYEDGFHGTLPSTGGGSKCKIIETHTLNKVGNVNPSGNGMNGCVCDSNYLAPTITTNKGEGSKILVKEATKKGYKEAYPGDSINLEHPNSNTRRGRVGVGVGVANCLTTSCNQAVVEPKENLVAVFTCHECNTTSKMYEKTFDTTPCPNCGKFGFGSVIYKKRENLIIEPNEINVIGRVDLNGHDLCKRIYSPQNISATIPTGQSGNTIPKILEGYTIIGSTQKHTTVNIDEICPTLTSAMGVGGGHVPMHNANYRIRKLTPYECLILMGLSHDDAMKLVNSGISNSQLYKMAGNSIITHCMRFLKKLEAIDILNEDKPQGQISLF